MGANIICLTSSGGLPLFSRQKGNMQPLPFAVSGSLNGVHLYGKLRGIEIQSTQTENVSVLWREYQDSITLIGIGRRNDEHILSDVLDEIFNAMIFLVGIDEIKNIRNAERLKRDLRTCYPLIDKLMECLDLGDRTIGNADIIHHVETLICLEYQLLQSCLDSYTECIGSLFACLTIENCIVVATDGWWELVPKERKLIALLVATNNDCTAVDIPVFLPYKSPSVPFRLVSICLLGSVWVTVLCGPKPDLTSVEHFSFQCWSPAVEILRAVQHIYPKNIPPTLQVHNSILGFLLINIEVGKFVSSRCSVTNKKDCRSPSEVLRTFYYQTAYLLAKNESQNTPVEAYWCSEFHKLHALCRGKNLLCVLYIAAIPVHTIRLITQQTLTLLTENSQLYW
ncbi:hypothetical protein AAG570_003498 [Ranatra chinensis]|uniref:Fuzzy n=1 Tax=Ranatra chinensis TaxID=642074 RepID=A0ABD0YIA3_9HEMI